MGDDNTGLPDHIAISGSVLRWIAGGIIGCIGSAVIATAWFYVNVMGAIDKQAYGFKSLEVGQNAIVATLEAHHVEAQQRSTGLQNQVLELRGQIFEILHERKR